MNRATLQNFALRLIAQETKGKRSSGQKTPAAFAVLERLRPHLSTFMGGVGFHALLSRALLLASAKVPWLTTVKVKPEGALEVMEAQVDSREVFEGSVALLAQLLELLEAFIGERLTLHLVQELWPEVSTRDLHVNKGDENENTK